MLLDSKVSAVVVAVPIGFRLGKHDHRLAKILFLGLDLLQIELLEVALTPRPLVDVLVVKL